MAANLIIDPEVQNDLLKIYAWYENLRFGLGEEFLTCVDARIAAICRSPKSMRILPGTTSRRRWLVRKFPYAIYYTFDEAKNLVVIYLVIHTSRNLDSMADRLPD